MTGPFYPSAHATLILEQKEISKKALQGVKTKINTVLKIFDFRENDYDLAGNSNIWGWSNFNSFANFGPLMTNNGALESSHQGEIDVAIWQGAETNTRNLC